jgi:hypothetical protein
MPATVTVPARGPLRLAAAVKPTVPLPVPEAGAVKVIQGTLASALHEQAAPVLTVMDPVPPPAGTIWDGGVTVKLQGSAG